MVTLSNGFLLCYNFYPHLISNLQQFGIDAKMMIRLCNIYKVGAYITGIQSEEDHFVICSDTPKIL
jgi:hypothetical protein